MANAATGFKSQWLDETTGSPIIEQEARRLTSFIDALADGRVDDKELTAQETRLVALMKDIEPRLSPELHAKVTELLCELTAYDLMQVVYTIGQARPKTKFRG
jgi:hypothetical protein